jgi:hypothetical protein
MTGEQCATFADLGVVALGQLGGDEVVGCGGFGCGADLVVGRVGPGQPDVLGNGAGDQERLLEDQGDVPEQNVAADLPHVDAADAHGARLDVVEAWDDPAPATRRDRG